MWLNQKQRTIALFLLLVSALLVSAWMSFRAVSRIAERERWVTHTYAALDSLDALAFNLQNAQSNAEGYVSTGRNKFLRQYHASATRITEQLATIQQLTSDNPDQQVSVAVLREKCEQAIQLLDSMVKSRATAPPGSDEQVELVIALLEQMKARETVLLQERSTDATASLRTTRIALVVGAVCVLTLLGLAAYMIVLEERQKTAFYNSRTQLAAIVDTSDDAIIGKTLGGTITSWNAGAERLYGYKAEEMIGKSIYEIVPHSRAEQLRVILERLSHGERVDHLETQRHRRDGKLLDVELTVSPLQDDRGKVVGASAIARDITERKRLEQSLHQLSARILQAQDEERRRIAREIHDSTVQKLALLALNMAQLQATSLPDKANGMLKNSEQLTRECVQELRTLSYVLHPPMMDELGLASALRIYIEGLSQRSGVEINLEADEDWPRLPHEVEMALFRVAQEGLSNVLRHSSSKSAAVKLSQQDGIELSVRDQGTGMKFNPADANSSSPVGVGIPGMSERIKQLGGVLTIDSGPGGTTLTARVPRERRAIA
jgi:PAS domain S-box-containing protein